MKNRHTQAAGLTLLTTALAAACGRSGAPAGHPLPSWRDTAARTAITSFVDRVTTQGGIDFIPEPERIAVFDNDGTLWPEAPMPFQLAFALDEVRRLATGAAAGDPMIQAALSGDLPTLLEGPHHDGLLRVLALTHAGLTTEEFSSRVTAWLETARHPRFDASYDQLTYQPMQELLAYVRSRGFKTFIVSGGGADFMRVWAERVYGIPPEQVVGSHSRVRYEVRDGRPVLVKTLDHTFVDDREGKPAGIHQFIGRRPILAVGNSDGDQAMIEYTTVGNARSSLGVLVHHTDADREYAYDANPPATGRLTTALAAASEHGWVVIDMRTDWATVFGASR